MATQKHVIIVGGGLVGALNACFFAKRGYDVDIYELREDIRSQVFVKGRSINLALSCRGREALKAVGLEDEIIANGIPMYGRMIHDLQGHRSPLYYGKKDQYIMSIDRRKLNEVLLTAAEQYPSVKLYFQHSFTSCDFEMGRATFIKEKTEQITVGCDLIVGCDGAFSSVRRQIMKNTRLDYNQMYVPHGYIELCIPSTKDGEFMMEKNYLHIWPRNTFMMIGLPNTEDCTFVITLFMPFSMFESIKNEVDLLAFFEKTFPDSIALIGKEALIKTYFSRKPLPLVSVKCSPYHVTDKAVIMGDAAHAMVPFYGQGMNCGFEDCLVLDDILDKCHDDFGKALNEYTLIRNPDAKAICDLAMYNYVEMRKSVNSRWFLLRKKVDNILYWFLPHSWVPLYTSVSFTRIPYTTCIKNRKWQDKVLKIATSLMATAAVSVGAVTVWRMSQDPHNSWSIDRLLTLSIKH